MPSNYTANYHLNQWEPGDKVLRADFNEDNAKIDAAIKAEADARAAGERALSAQLSGKGNCQIWTYSYTGNGKWGQDNAVRVTFPGMPLTAFIIGSNGTMLILPTVSGSSRFMASTNGFTSVKWSGTTASWYTNSEEAQMNINNVQYMVIAVYLKS